MNIQKVGNIIKFGGAEFTDLDFEGMFCDYYNIPWNEVWRYASEMDLIETSKNFTTWEDTKFDSYFESSIASRTPYMDFQVEVTDTLDRYEENKKSIFWQMLKDETKSKMDDYVSKINDILVNDDTEMMKYKKICDIVKEMGKYISDIVDKWI